MASALLAATGQVLSGVAGSFRQSLGAVSLALLASSLLAGCDLFGTKEFSPRPAEIKAFAGALTRVDTIAFRVVESLAGSGAADSATVLARRQIRFARAPDTQQPPDGWIAVSFRIYADPPGAALDEGICYVRFASDGVSVRAPDSATAGVGGARYFPLKVSAASEYGSADSLALLSLPPAFVLGGAWTQALGVLTVGRDVAGMDTLEYRGRLEETWRIDETVSDGGRVLSRGLYWYGATGLLKAEQSWSLEERDADGASASLRELRRVLVRL